MVYALFCFFYVIWGAVYAGAAPSSPSGVVGVGERAMVVNLSADDAVAQFASDDWRPRFGGSSLKVPCAFFLPGLVPFTAPECVFFKKSKASFLSVTFSQSLISSLRQAMVGEPRLRNLLPVAKADLQIEVPAQKSPPSVRKLGVYLVDTIPAPRFLHVSFFNEDDQAVCRFWVWDPHGAHVSVSVSQHADLYETNAVFASFERPGFLPLKVIEQESDRAFLGRLGVLLPSNHKIYFGEYSWATSGSHKKRSKPFWCRVRLSNGYLVNETMVQEGEKKMWNSNGLE